MLSSNFKQIFFDKPELEELSAELTELEKREVIARNILKFLLHGECQNFKAIAQMVGHVLKGTLKQKDPAALYILRKEANKIFQRIYKKNDRWTVDESIRERVDLSMANLLSYYVVFEPTGFDKNLKIPRKIGDSYHLIEYKIEAIEITPKDKKVIKHPIKDNQRVFAYGLTPVNNNNANRILAFCGTTFPVGQGSFTQISMNLFPHSSLGEHYNWEKIKDWLNSGDNQRRIDVCGASQGGGLSLLVGLMFPDKIRRIDAMNPPGMLQDYDENHTILGAWERAKKNNERCPKVYIQNHVGDPVSKVGYWKPDWKVLKLKVNSEYNWLTWFVSISIFGFHPGFYSAHIVNFSGVPNSQIEKLSGEQDNTLLRHKRTFYVMNIVRRIICRLFDTVQSLFSSYTLKDEDKRESNTPCEIHSEVYFQTVQSTLNSMKLPYLALNKELNKKTATIPQATKPKRYIKCESPKLYSDISQKALEKENENIGTKKPNIFSRQI